MSDEVWKYSCLTPKEEKKRTNKRQTGKAENKNNNIIRHH